MPADPAGQFGPAAYAGWRATGLGSITEDLERRLVLRLAGDIGGRRVLDVGCGDGGLTMALHDNSASSVVGCDVDPRMIARAVAQATQQQAAIAYAVARAESLPFGDSSFDIVTAVTVMAFVRQPEAAMREIARVLRPGGCLVLADLGRWSLWAAARRIRGWLGAEMWRPARFRSVGELRALAQAAQLRVEHVAGAVYYPRCAPLATLMAPADSMLGELTTFGAAFLAMRAGKA